MPTRNGDNDRIPLRSMVNHFYLSTNGYNLAQRRELCRRQAERMESTFGVTNVAYSDGIPLGFGKSCTLKPMRRGLMKT